MTSPADQYIGIVRIAGLAILIGFGVIQSCRLDLEQKESAAVSAAWSSCTAMLAIQNEAVDEWRRRGFETAAALDGALVAAQQTRADAERRIASIMADPVGETCDDAVAWLGASGQELAW